MTRLFVNENKALVSYIAEGIGYGTLTETVAKEYLDSGALIQLNRGQGFNHSLALIWYPRSQRLPFFEDLVRSVK